MYPLLPSKITQKLSELSLKIQSEARALEGDINPYILESLEDLMLPINSYYTNAMEGNPSKLSDIEAAEKNIFSSNKQTRNYQREHLAHIAVQKLMLDRLKKEPEIEITSLKFLCWLHFEFYKRLPDEMHVVTTTSGKILPVYPGQLRDRQAEVGRHLPPTDAKEISHLLKQFSKNLSPKNINPKMQFLAFASSHHRLLWIHPFRDGNGRVARLFSEAFSYCIGLSKHNLWTISRAFARNRKNYDFHLALADQERRNDLDGRGPLSEENLIAFCEYFLTQNLDQIQYMNKLLNCKTLEKRFNHELNICKEEKTLSKGAIDVLRFTFFKGEIRRGDVQKICHVKARRAGIIIKELLDKARLSTTSPRKGKLRLRFSADSIPIIFPGLI